MDQTEMLHQMCHEVLAEADLRAICKTRGLPNPAAYSRPLLETLFLSDTGVAAALRALDRTEIALLHLLRSQDKPVGVAFFSRLDPPKRDEWLYGTFSQRFQSVFSKVKDRLVRAGLLLLALGPEGYTKKTKMERWLFALPVPFARHLPPLLESPRRLSGEGDWPRDVGRDMLNKAVAGRKSEKDPVEIVNGKLCWGGQPFRAESVVQWQKLRWQGEMDPAKPRKDTDAYTMPPAEATLRLLAGLDADHWSDTDALAVPLEVFCGDRVDAGAVCESGWRWGLLARQVVEGRKWYRLVPPEAATEVPPERYLAVRGAGVTVDLDSVPFATLETLVSMSDQRPDSGGRPRLLVTPNLVKLGRTAETVAALPLADWLQKNAPAFHQAFEAIRQRRGKTILHDNLAVARVTDLSLKVALERALGKRLVPLSEEFLAFPTAAVAEVRRLVTQMGHVVKEVGHR